jgi:hypothetical protein
MLIPLTYSGICLMGFSSTQAAHNAFEDATKSAETTVTMFPDGVAHDFGKVTRGTQCRYAFRIINTTNVRLRIISLRCS